MKALLTLSGLLILSSCGKIDVTSTNLGQKITFNPQAMSARDVQNVQSICSALSKKETNLSASTAGTYTFGVTTRGCTESGDSAEVLVATSVESAGSGYKFRRNDTSAYFVFQEVETSAVGIMKTLCQNSGTQVDQVKDPVTNVVTTFSTTEIEDCTYKGDEICLLVNKAVPNGNDFEVVSKEWVKFRVNGTTGKGNLGFWTSRKLMSNTSCALNQTSTTIATLKD